MAKRKNMANKPNNADISSEEIAPEDSIEKSQSTGDIVAVVEATPVTAGASPMEQAPMAETVEEIPGEAGEGGTNEGPGEEKAKPGERREIVRSASLVMLGNLGSSVMGMVRQSVVASAGRNISGPFLAALIPAQTFSDFLISGSVAGALIPTFNDYAAPEKREELRRIVFTIINLLMVITLGISLLFFFLAPWLTDQFLASGYVAQNRNLTVQYARIIFFSLIALGPFYVLMSALYALKEFGWPAFATAAYHLGIVIGAIVGGVLGTRYFGEYGIAFGVLLGVVGEIALLIPGMRNQHFRYKLVLDLMHPALRRILILYAPIAFSYLVSSILRIVDLYFATNSPCAPFMHGACGEANLSAMQFATTLIQFPIGLVAAALSFAVLPTLTAHAREGNLERFKGTLLLGFRLGLLLMIPAAAGLIVLQRPIISAIFQHGQFKLEDALNAGLALQNYAYQLPFVAIDQLLINAFYARKNTIIPVIVGIVSILGYLVVALPFRLTVGMPALALANTAQNSLHAVILLFLLRKAIGSLHARTMIPAFIKIVIATAVMVGVAWGLLMLLGQIPFFASSGFIGQVLTLVIAGGLAAAVYFGCVLLLKVEEIHLLKGAVLAKLGKK